MTMLLFLGYMFTVGIIIVLFLDMKKPKGFPPGPAWLPLLGNYFLYHRLFTELGFTHLVWTTLAKSYGALVGIRLGRNIIILASGYSVMKEMLNKDEFEGRPDGFLFRLRAFGQRLGIVFVDGQFYQNQRRFCLYHLRNFGLGRSSMEERIAEEARQLVLSVKEKYQNGAVPIQHMFNVSVLNGLWAIVAGQRYEVDDSRLLEMLYCVHTSFRLLDMSGGILNHMPYLRHFAPDICSYNQITQILDTLYGYFKEVVAEHHKTMTLGSPRDLVDAFLQEMERNNGTDTTYSEEQLLVLLLDLFIAGSEVTSSTLGFAVLYLIHYPDMQLRVQEQLDCVVGKNRQLALQDKLRLPYLEAFIMEMQRHSNPAVTTIAHRAKQDTLINGYMIPQNATIIASLYSVHMDKDHWGDPEVFRPDRFLDDKGEAIQHNEWFMPFGIGRRRCLGEMLAKNTMFLFLGTLLQKFTISSANESLPTLEAHDGATLSPKAFNAIFTPRD